MRRFNLASPHRAGAAFFLRKISNAAISVVGSSGLIAVAVITVIALSTGSFGLFIIGAIVAGISYGAAFSGAVSLIMPHAQARERGQLFAAVYIVSYVAFGVAAITGGLFVAHAGLITVDITYVVVIIAAPSLGTTSSAPPPPPRPALSRYPLQSIPMQANIPCRECPAARASIEIATAHLTPAILNHRYRSRLWARGFAELENLSDLDEELLFAAAIMHDIALVESFDGHRIDFEDASRQIATVLAAGDRWDPDRRRHPAAAIDAHAPLPEGVLEGHVLDLATSLDIGGARAQDLPDHYLFGDVQ